MEFCNGKKNSHLTLSTHEPLFRQGHVGDLQTKSRVEILDLLQRQEKLLANRSFIAKLPDRGNKIERFVAALRIRLQDFEDVCTSSLNDSVGSSKSGLTSDEEQPESALTAGETLDANLSIVEKGFSDLSIHEGPHYAVVKKASAKTKPSKFMLNRAKEKAASNDEVECNAKTETVSGRPKIETSAKTVNDNVDLSAATIRNPKNKAQLISIEESRNLYTKQQAIIKEQQSNLMAQRILSKYGGVGLDQTAPSSSLRNRTELDSTLHFCDDYRQENVDDLDALD